MNKNSNYVKEVSIEKEESYYAVVKIVGKVNRHTGTYFSFDGIATNPWTTRPIPASTSTTISGRHTGGGYEKVSKYVSIKGEREAQMENWLHQKERKAR